MTCDDPDMTSDDSLEGETSPDECEEFPPMNRETLRRMPEDPQVMKDLKRGIDAMKAGEMVPWDEMKKNLGL